MVTDRAKWKKFQERKDGIRGTLNNPNMYIKKMKGLFKKDDPKFPGVQPTYSPLSTKPKNKIYTGTALDELLSYHGGLEEGSSLELYGEFASGKTQIVQALLAEGAGLLVYIDAEDTYRPDRFREICESRGKDPEEINSRLLLYHPEDWIEQEYVTINLPEFDEKGKFLEVGLVVVDSLMAHFASDPEFLGRQNLPIRQGLVRSEVHRLKRYCKRHKAVLVYTNQISRIPVARPNAPLESRLGGRGGDTVAHLADYRILLRKARGNIRVARLVDSVDKPLIEVPFILDESGIKDIPEAAERAKAMEKVEKYGEKFLSGQWDSKAAARKYLEKAREMGFLTGENVEKILEEIKEKVVKEEAEG